MTPEQKAEFVKLFSGPRRLGRSRFCGRRYDLVLGEDGEVVFVQNEFDKLFDEVMDEIFGPSTEEET